MGLLANNEGLKTKAMKKFIFFLIGMLMMLSLGAMTAQSTSPAMDNKASPPEINTSSNYHPFETMLVAAIVEVVPAPLITWGYNNVMTSEETAAPTIPASTRILRFLGPGDSFMLGYAELNNLRCCAFEDYAIDPSRKIGGNTIV